ncbi:MAG: hypothetical protein VKK98_01995 [Cyanobacteriota bacterium]|nr:hypothetical protein [Cyanobacteriota bacterium]
MTDEPLGAICDLRSVQWQVAGDQHELRSASHTILNRAATILAQPDSIGSVSTDRDPFLWQVDEVGGWQVRGPDGSDLGVFASAEDAIRRVEYGAHEQLFATDSPFITLHAALLGIDHAGLLLVGPGGSGKSTLATALWQAGFNFHGDDVALVAPDGAGLSAAPRRVSLRRPSQELLGDELWQRISVTPSFMLTSEGCLFHPHELAGLVPAAAPLSPGVIIFLARSGAEELDPAELRSLSAAELLVALAPYSNVMRTGGMGAALQRLQPLAARTPAYDLGRGPLASMLAAIDGVLPSKPQRP